MKIALLLSAALLVAAPAFAQQRFVIERDIPAPRDDPEQLRAAAQKSNAVLRDLGPDIQWVPELRGRRQDLLRLQRPQRGVDPQPRREVGLPRQQDHAGVRGHRPDHGPGRAVGNSKQDV